MTPEEIKAMEDFLETTHYQDSDGEEYEVEAEEDEDEEDEDATDS